MLRVKRLGFFMTALMLLSVIFVVQMPTKTFAAPTITNPGFETGSVSPWVGTGTFAVVSGNAHSGTYSARINNANSQMTQVITGLTPNTQYTLKAWAKVARGNVSIGVTDFGGTQVAYSTNSTSYVQLSMTFTTGASNTTAKIFVWKGNAGYGYADDYTVTGGGSTTPMPVGVGGTWTLKFSDEFDGTSLDTNKWYQLRGEPGSGYGDPCNPSLENAYYTTNNSWVSGGNLVLNLSTTDAGGYPYSSGWVQSYNKFDYKYGYAEARINVPNFTGMWPAFWALPTPVVTWPPEIDIFEFFNEPFPKFNYHFGTWPNNQQMGPTQYGSSNCTGAFHTYGLLWNSSRIQVYFDGQPGPSYTTTANITSSNMYLIFNLAIYQGYNPPNGQQMLIDYCRVWQ